MPKAGMKRPDPEDNHAKNKVKPVPEIQGAAKHGKKKAGSLPD